MHKSYHEDERKQSSLGLSKTGSGVGRVQVLGPADAAERVFVGGLPYYLTDEQCRELLQSFGPIKSFDLVKDRETGNSKGCLPFCSLVALGSTGILKVFITAKQSSQLHVRH